MKYALTASMLALGLAACGGGGGSAKATLVDACIEDGQDKDACSCQVNALEEALGSDTLKKMADLAEGEDEAAAEKLMMEIMGEDLDAVMKLGTAMAACGS